MNIKNEYGHTLLWKECRTGNVELAEALYVLGASVDLGDVPPLVQVSGDGNIDMVQWLMDRGTKFINLSKYSSYSICFYIHYR